MTTLWSPEYKIILERRLWVAVLRAQKDLGLDVPDGSVAAYEAVIDHVDLDSIAARERITRHDVKARIDEFAALAGQEQIHKGMTSRDVTENVEQLQVRSGLQLVRHKALAVLARLGRRAVEYDELVMAGRTHNVAAQATTLGKRFASAADELLVAVARLDELMARYPLRGIQGPVGTAQDIVDLSAGILRGWQSSSRLSLGILGSTGCSLAWGRFIRVRSTTTCCPLWCSWRPHPRLSPRRSGSWPAMSSPPKAFSPGRWVRRPCRTR
jgi:adenylosuccinate lyase